MSSSRLTRRAFIAATGAVSLAALAGCGGGGDTFTPRGPQTAFRLSTRGIDSASNAAQANAANKRFVSMAAAEAGRAHPGDKSQVVPITVSLAIWTQWFGSGASAIDLRTL